jgi:DNA-binding NtrC family response regulator
MTGQYTTETAVEAIRQGAADYLEKPVRLNVLRQRVWDLLEASRQRKLALSSGRAAEAQFEGIVAKSTRMWKMFDTMQRIAPHYRSVLVRGPTGSGKDLVARALHRLSEVTGNYVVLNCSAVVETLFESELFGHVKGAFTGADAGKEGLFEHADKGTLFLDEIGDMPLGTQAKLLRAIQNQEVQRVGSLTPRRVSVRVVAATHRDLRKAIQEGSFREDLYYRLSMVEIDIPPLNERAEDIRLLTEHFIAKFVRDHGKQLKGVSEISGTILERYSWPGNVRELENVIVHGCMMATGDLIEVSNLPSRILLGPDAVRSEAAVPASIAAYSGDQFMAVHERQLVIGALDVAKGNQSMAAKKLGIGRDALRYKMKKYGVS